MIHYNPIVSGSLVITGSLVVTQTISGTITASYVDYNSVANKPSIVSSSTQIVSLLPAGVLSSSVQVSTSLPNGVISGSSQLTSSYDSRYILSGSITETTWNNIASKPTGIVSGSEQIVGILSSLNTYTGSNDTTNTIQNNKLSRLEESTSSLNSFTASNANTSLNTYTGSNDTTNTTQNTRLSRIEESTSSLNSYTQSNDTTNTTQNTRLSRIEESTSSLNSYTSSLKTAIALTGSNVTVLGNFRVDGTTTTIGGNLVVQGTTTTVSSSNLTVQNNLIYLNDGGEGVNLDLGWAGNYNDGTYAHAGMFRDASDGVFRPFKGYTPEPSQSIDITHPSFQLADFEAANLTGIIKSRNGVVSGSSQIIGILSSLNTYTGSNDTLNTLQSTRIDQLAASTASVNSFTSSAATTYEGRASATKTLISGSTNSTNVNFTISGGSITANLIGGVVSGSGQISGTGITNNTITIAGQSTALGSSVTAETIRTAIGTVVTGSGQISGTGITNNTITIAGQSTALGSSVTAETIRTAIGTVVTGSAQISLASTTGFGTYINQAVLTTSSPTFATLVVTGTSANTLQVRNTTASSNSNLQMGNDGTTNGGGMALFGSTYVASAQYRTSGTYIYSNLAGGLTLHAEGANSMYLATNGTAAVTISSAQAVSFTNVPTANSSTMRTDANTAYSTTFTSVSSVSVTHNLGTKNVMVMCYDSADEMFWPATIKTTSTSVVDITFTTSRSGRVVITR
jgi:hypothetical protein